MHAPLRRRRRPGAKEPDHSSAVGGQTGDYVTALRLGVWLIVRARKRVARHENQDLAGGDCGARERRAHAHLPAPRPTLCVPFHGERNNCIRANFAHLQQFGTTRAKQQVACRWRRARVSPIRRNSAVGHERESLDLMDSMRIFVRLRVGEFCARAQKLGRDAAQFVSGRNSIESIEWNSIDSLASLVVVHSADSSIKLGPASNVRRAAPVPSSRPLGRSFANQRRAPNPMPNCATPPSNPQVIWRERRPSVVANLGWGLLVGRGAAARARQSIFVGHCSRWRQVVATHCGAAEESSAPEQWAGKLRRQWHENHWRHSN